MVIGIVSAAAGRPAARSMPVASRSVLPFILVASSGAGPCAAAGQLYHCYLVNRLIGRDLPPGALDHAGCILPNAQRRFLRTSGSGSSRCARGAAGRGIGDLAQCGSRFLAQVGYRVVQQGGDGGDTPPWP